MGASAGGQRLPSGGLAGQGGSTPVGDAVRNIGGQGGRQGGFNSPILHSGQVGQVSPAYNRSETIRYAPSAGAQQSLGNMNQQQLSTNPYQQAAGAQQQALATTGAATQFQTSPTAMGRMAAGMAYQPPSAATGTMIGGMGYQPPSLAQKGFQSAIGYNPQQVAATSFGAAQEVTPQTAASAMQRYQNPYETQVVQQTLSDVARQAQIERQNMLGQYTGRKAFGSRRDVAEDTFAENLGKALTSAAAPLRQQGFQTALGAGQFDVGQQAASTARNVAAENAARQFGAQTGMTAQQLNQAAGLSGGQLNLAGTQALSGADLAAQQARMAAASQLAGTAAQAEQLGMGAAGQVAGAQRADQQMRMGAAGQLANLGQQSFGYGTAIQGQQQRAGEMDRAIMQNLIGAGQQSFGQYTGAPTTGLQTLIGALTGVPQGQSQSFQPGLFNYLQLGASL